MTVFVGAGDTTSLPSLSCVRDTVKGIQERLKPDAFLRVDRSAIVNLEFVQRLEPYEHGKYVITMKDGSRIQSSRTHGPALRAALGCSSRN